MAGAGGRRGGPSCLGSGSPTLYTHMRMRAHNARLPPAMLAKAVGLSFFLSSSLLMVHISYGIKSCAKP